MFTRTTVNSLPTATYVGATIGSSTYGETRNFTTTDSAFTVADRSAYNSANSGRSQSTISIREWSATLITTTFSETSAHTENTVYTTTGGDVSATDTFTASSSIVSAEISGNTSFGNSRGISTESGYTSAVTIGTGVTTNATTGSQTTSSTPNPGPSSTARTYTGSSTVESRPTYTYGTSSVTTTATANDSRYTTSSSSWDDTTATPTTTRSSWNTDTTLVSHAHTVSTEDTTSLLTVQGDTTTTSTDTTTFTSSSHHMLQDTVYRLSDGGSEFLIGYMLWSKSSAGPDTTTAKYTEVFSPQTGNSFTISDYLKFTTATLSIPVNNRSIGTTTTGTSVVTTTFTDGYSVYSTSSHTNSFSLGDISTTLSTDTNGSTTLFTCQDFVSGYATTGDQPFTTGTTTRAWQSTTVSGTREAWASSYATTATKESRSVTADTVLGNVQTVTRTTGTSSYLSFLGLSKFTTSRIIAERITVTSTAWHTGLLADNYTRTAESTGASTLTSGATSISASHDYTLITSSRLALFTTSASYGPPVGNEAWMTTPARGWAGFCGTFTPAAPPVYLTSTSGLAAGAVFPSAGEAIALGTFEMQENNGVRIAAVNSTTGITLAGIGMSSSSLISTPTALTTSVGIAATWTSTTTSGTTTTRTTLLATHSAAVSNAIAGDYWTSHSIAMDSTDANIGYNSPHASLGGYGAGNNLMGSHEVRLAAGAATWTRYTAGVSDSTGPTASTSSSAESVSFTVPQGAAVRVAIEPVYTLSWVTSYTGDHARSASPHQSFA